MKSLFLIGALPILLLIPRKAEAQFDVIEEIIKAAIMAVDLGVQKIQTQTIVLQDAQKQVENIMQETQLSGITTWLQQQKNLFREYYNELWQVKNAISTYSTVKKIIVKQVQLVSDYKNAWALLRQDKHFGADEVSHIYNVYQGILTESLHNVDQLAILIQALALQMHDGERLDFINTLGDRIDRNYYDLQTFTQENILLSLQRANSEQDLISIKQLYNIP